MEIIGQVLYNAFIQALYPSLENSISISSVKPDNEKKPKTFLGKIFGKSKKDMKGSDDKKEKDKKKKN